jgi:HK97 family phage prohead protease
MTKKLKKEKRTIDFRNASLRFDETEGVIYGDAIVYNEESNGERVAPGAVTKTLKEAGGSRDIKALFNHDKNFVLGSLKNGTLRLIDTPEALQYEIDAPNWARETIVESIARGDIDGSSFGFMPIKHSRVQGEAGSIRQLDEVALLDVGPVTFPWYGGTSSGYRDIDEQVVREYTIADGDKEVPVGDIIDEWQERQATTQEPVDETTPEPEYVPKPLSLLRQKLELKRKA